MQDAYEEWRKKRQEELRNLSDRLGGGISNRFGFNVTGQSREGSQSLLRGFRLSRPSMSGGVIIQYVIINIFLVALDGSYQTEHIPYWEGWDVPAGRTEPTLNSDLFSAGKGLPSGYSSMTVTWAASASYYEGKSMPINFTARGAGDVVRAGQLSSREAPIGFDLSTGTPPVIVYFEAHFP